MQTMWFLKWIPWAFLHRHNPLVTNWIFSHSGINLTWNTSVPLIGLILSPITWACGLVFTYNLALVFGVIGSAWAAYFVAIRLFNCRYLAALLAGAVYGFSPFAMAHALGHLNFTVAFAPPLFMLVLHDIFITQSNVPWLNGMKLAALTVAQYLINPEVLLTTALLTLFAVCAIALSSVRHVTRQQVIYAARAFVFALLVTFPLLSFPLYTQLFGPWRPMQPVHESANYVADLFSFVLPTSVQAMSVGTSRAVTSEFSGNVEEWNTYLGIPLIILLIHIFYVRREHRSVQFVFAGLLGVAVLSMGSSLHLGGHVSGIPLPWRLFAHIPIIQNIQPSRFGEYMFLFAGLLIAIYLSEETVLPGRNVGRLVASLVAVTFLVPRLPFPMTSVKVPEFFRSPSLVGRIESPALIIPFATAGCTTAMLWQATSDFEFKMPEGFAIGPEGAHGQTYGPTPTPLSRAILAIQDSGRVPTLKPPLRAEIADVVRKQQIKTIVLGPSPHDKGLLAFLQHLLRRPPEFAGGVLVWRHIDRAFPTTTVQRRQPTILRSGSGWHRCLQASQSR